MGKEEGGTVLPPLIRRIGGKINGPIRIWEAAQTEFVVKIRIRIHKSRTNSYFDFFACRRFFWSTVTFGTNSYFGAQYPPACPCMDLKFSHGFGYPNHKGSPRTFCSRSENLTSKIRF